MYTTVSENAMRNANFVLCVDNGAYSNFNFYKRTFTKDSDGDLLHFYALFTLHDGYVETRNVTLQNNKIVAWHT